MNHSFGFEKNFWKHPHLFSFFLNFGPLVLEKTNSVKKNSLLPQVKLIRHCHTEPLLKLKQKAQHVLQYMITIIISNKKLKKFYCKKAQKNLDDKNGVNINEKKIFKQEKDNFWCSMWVKRQLILLFFSFIAKFTYVSLSMSVLCHPHNVRGLESTRGRRLSGVDSGLLALWGWYCSCIKCNFHKFIAIIRHWIIKSRFINYFLEKFYHVLLVYKERERMFFSDFSRTEWLYVTSGTLPLSFFLFALQKNSRGLLLYH